MAVTKIATSDSLSGALTHAFSQRHSNGAGKGHGHAQAVDHETTGIGCPVVPRGAHARQQQAGEKHGHGMVAWHEALACPKA